MCGRRSRGFWSASGGCSGGRWTGWPMLVGHVAGGLDVASSPHGVESCGASESLRRDRASCRESACAARTEVHALTPPRTARASRCLTRRAGRRAGRDARPRRARVADARRLGSGPVGVPGGRSACRRWTCGSLVAEGARAGSTEADALHFGVGMIQACSLMFHATFRHFQLLCHRLLAGGRAAAAGGQVHGLAGQRAMRLGAARARGR